MTIDDVTDEIIGAAMRVHSAIGPGSLEKVYDSCMSPELERAGLQFKHQVTFPVTYHGLRLDAAFRVDDVIEDCVLLEIKAVEKAHPLHVAQLLSYFKSTHKTLGLLINFNVIHLRDGVHRVANGYTPGQVVRH